MTSQIRIYERLTHGYRDGWSHLDGRRYIGKLRMTAVQCVRQPSGYEDGGTYLRYARLPRGLSAAQKRRWLRAIASTLSGTDCQHDYDCCGCRLVWARPRLIGNRQVRIAIGISYNY